MPTRARTLVPFLALAMAWCVDAATLIVDGKHPAAADENPGTLEAPFKTIQAAVNKAQAGDTVAVRAGVYHESVNFKGKHGRRHGAIAVHWGPDETQYITLEAYGDEKVVLDGTAEVTGFALVPGHSNLYVAPFTYSGWAKHLEIVFAGAEQLLPYLTKNPNPNQPDLPLLPAMPGDTPDDRGWYYDKASDRLYVNLGGTVPGRDVPMRAAVFGTGVDAANCYFPRIRKLEIRGFNQHGVVIYNALGAVVEDNYIHHVSSGIFANPSMDVYIRRNTITHVGNNGMTLGGNRGGIVESNVIRDFNVNPFRTRAYAGSIMCNGIIGTALRFNVITRDLYPCICGPWPDCNGLGNAWYGNVCYRMSAHGFYIEAGLVGNVLRWNNCFENGNGITFRQNYMNVAIENWVHRNKNAGLVLGSTAAENVLGNYMADNAIVSNRIGLTTGSGPDKTRMNAFDRNLYIVPTNGFAVQYDDRQFATVAAAREALSIEAAGRQETTFDPASLGLVSFRVSGTQNDHEPVQMFGNPDMSRWDLLQEQGLTAPYFWNKGTFRESYTSGWRGSGVSHAGVPSTLDGMGGFIRHLDVRSVAYVRNYPGGVTGGEIENATAHSGNWLLQIGSEPGKAIAERGLAWWSPAVPTVAGAEVDISLWVELYKVQTAAGAPAGGLFIFTEWADITGQNVRRSYLVGGEAADNLKRPELVYGTYGYTNIRGTVTAPPGAVWMRLAFGLRSCTGWAAFDDAEFQTRPGVAVVAAGRALPIDAARFRWAPVDLSAVVNRALTDETPDDGQGGWTDQGAAADMRNLPTGRQTWHGVEYFIRPAERAAVVLRSPRRPQSGHLPEAVEIPIGARATVIAFLHTGAWIEPDLEHWRYVVQYADGQEAVVKCVGGRNIADWTDTPPDSAFDTDPGRGWTRIAVTVGSSRFPTVSAYSTLWKNPRPDAEIRAIRMEAAGAGVPILLAISLGAHITP